tara:strand:- start:259 stop:1401 length:1143 start_codon:yes stop_codon:yes gene_type:complete
MIIPKYGGKCISNVTPTIASHFGTKTGPINKDLKKDLKGKKNIVLLVLDGFGYNYFMKHRKNLNMFNNASRVEKITAVFPSTTAASLTSFTTGVPPGKHGLISFHCFVKEFGMVTNMLSFTPRYGKIEGEIKDLDGFLKEKSVFSKVKKANSFVVSHKAYQGGEYSNMTSKGSKYFPYNTLNGLFKQVNRVLKKRGNKLIYAYWPMIDSLLHELGVNSSLAKQHLLEIDKKIEALRKKIGRDTIILVSADHGMVNVDWKNTVVVNDHPKFDECLTVPITGDGRGPFLFVRPGKEKQLLSYFNKYFKRYGRLYKTSELVKKNLFGENSDELYRRAGDYMILCKPNCMFKQFMFKSERKKLKGNHGGVSEDEMLVPLIYLNP